MGPVVLGGGPGARSPDCTADDGVRFLRLERSATIELAAVWRRGTDALVDGFVTHVRAVTSAAGGRRP